MNQKKMILVVDDNPHNLKILGGILRDNGYSSAFAQNGAKALNAVKIGRPALILLDVQMPDMNGFAVCQQLKQDATTKDIPVIFLTANTEKEDMIEGLELGAVDYVTKPFNRKELITRINTHIELKDAKEKLNQALKELQQALAAKDKFFSIIGHDLANVFSASLGSVNRLAETGRQLDENKQDELMALVKNSLESGHNLLQNLLYWSRIQTGRMPIQLINVNLKTVVERNIALLESNAKAKNIAIWSSVDTLLVFADENMLDTVIRNLLSNALKFTPAGGKVEISAKPVEDNRIELSISDTGVGIKPENFDKLFRIDVSYSTRGTAEEMGTGLGLILCQEFMEKNGGTIGVESEPGKGSRFYLRLPLERRE